MSAQSQLVGLGDNPAVRSPVRSHFRLAVILTIIVIVEVLVLTGQFPVAYGLVVPIIAALAGVCGRFAPRILLGVFFVSAPLIWGLGDASALGASGASVNLPMLAGFILVVAFGHELLQKEQDAGIERIRKLILALGAVCIPAIFFASGLSTGAGVYVRLMSPYIIMFAVLRHVHGKAETLQLVRSMALALLAVGVVFAVANSRSELWTNLEGYTRLTMLDIPTQVLANYLAVLIAIILLNYLLTRNIGYLLLIPFALASLFLTYFRTGWVGVVVVLGVLMYHVNKSYFRRLLIAGLVLAPLYFTAIRQGLLRYRANADSVGNADVVLSGRLGIDAIAIDTYLNAPFIHKLFGIGYGQVAEATRSVYGSEFQIHCDYLGWLIEAGVFALLLYVAILLSLLKRSRRGKAYAKDSISYHTCGVATALVIGTIVMGIPGAFYTQVLAPSYIFGIIGLMLGHSYVREDCSHGNCSIGVAAAYD